MEEKIAALLPAYKPDETFVTLCRELRFLGFNVWVVDDGSGEEYRHLFDTVQDQGCTVLRHAVNLGKGRAIKTGINAIADSTDPIRGVVTADADGQHAVDDIKKVADTMLQKPSALITGCRRLSNQAPLKSRLGNAASRYAYQFVTGTACHDTQTGLRAIPFEALKACLAIPGERFEYEMNMLLRLREMRLALHEVEIETIYLDHNKGSHFRPFQDALRVFSVIIRFAMTSLLSFLIDFAFYAFFLGTVKLTPALSFACARLISSFINFLLNRAVVFRGLGGKGAVFRYYMLVILLLLVGSGLVELVSSLVGYSAAWMKIPVDALLFFVSFWIQREYVFKEQPTPSKPDANERG